MTAGDSPNLRAYDNLFEQAEQILASTPRWILDLIEESTESTGKPKLRLVKQETEE